MNTLTVFTPTYNRINTLIRLYDSLLCQTSHQFTWIIVDDGSTDDTSTYVHNWQKESPFEIKYFYQENSGKPTAHNRGVEETQSDLFTCVDSDDILTPNAIEFIVDLNCDDNKSVGFLLKKGKLDGTPLTRWNDQLEKATLYEAYSNYGLSGDTMLVFKSEIIKKYRFPFFQGEKFVPEAYLYDLIDQDGYLIAYDKVLYLCEYLNDGISANMRKVNALNPNGYLAYIKQRLCIDKKIKEIVTDLVRYNAIKFVFGKKWSLYETSYPLLSFLCILPGALFYHRYYARFVKGNLGERR